ncbi:hypothetical protein [Ensifer soli]|uniref:hypothetical protein n=1 Tax=Ciceribacter sp. sgz301302 TaxID=3342379 RepID=UPI0035B78EF6
MGTLPLFDRAELGRIRAEREALLRRLKRVRMDPHSRIRTEKTVALLTARQIALELELGRR